MRTFKGFILGVLLAGGIGYWCWYDATHLSVDEMIEMEHAR